MQTALILTCLKIFFSRITDVSFGTLRTIFSVKGKIALATLCGFIETFLWFIMARQALSSASSSIFVALSYAAGFAAGTYVGGLLAKKFIKSNLTVQIITSSRDTQLIATLRSNNLAVSVMDVNPSDYSGEKYMLLCEIKAERLNELKTLVHSFDPKAFMIVNETKYVYNGFIK